MQLTESSSQSRSSHAEALATGRILVGAGLITAAQLVIAMKQREMYLARGESVFIDEVLMRNRFVSEKDIAAALEKENGGSKRGIFRTILPLEVCERFSVLPIRVVDDVLEIKSSRRLTPANERSIIKACIERVNALKIMPADLVEITEAHKRLSTGEFTFEQVLSYMKSKEISGTILKQAINAMLCEAIDMRASDLRLDRRANPDSWISHRVDGVVNQTHLLDEKMMGALFTRMKNECNMDASDNRRAQDGRISISYKGRAIDFRVNTQPCDGGESMAMRVLDGESVPGLEMLFPNQPDMTDLFKRISRVKGKQGGIVLFSGPTGSGKTTSLYSLTQRFHRDAMNVMTVENPIEFKLPFARQVQLNTALDEKMSDVERSMLRQDPDVLMLGEIRDHDGMKTALHFAESGHMVVATIHAKSAEETFGRILSMIGTEAKEDALYLLANTLRVVINQQLAPRLCSCTAPVPLEEIDEATERGEKAGIVCAPDAFFYKRVGCPKCRQTGYFGRVAAHETMIIPMEPEVRKNLSKILFDGMNSFNKISSLAGVDYKSRAATFARLIEGGVIDVDGAIANLGSELS